MKGEHVYIVGGGNSAGQAAMHFASTAKRISMVVREDSLTQTLSQYLIDRIQATPNVDVLSRTEVTALHGEHALDGITLVDPRPGRSGASQPVGCSSASAACHKPIGHRTSASCATKPAISSPGPT